jgi:transposase
MPKSTVVDIPPEEHAEMLAARRRARYGSWLTLHILLLCARGRTPTAIAAVLLCARSSVYRTVRADREGTLGLEHEAQGRLAPPVRTAVLRPTLRRSLLALLKAAPRAHGWCRTRWSGTPLALTLEATRGIQVSAETMRRWVHEVGWVWKRANLVAKDDAPHRVERVARIRFAAEQLRRCETIVCADELDLHLVPKVGDAWMPPGTQVEVMTPGTHAKHDLAGALAVATGTLHPCQGPRKTNVLFRDLLQPLEDAYPAAQDERISVVVDNDQIPQAKAVDEWLANHPRVTLLWLPPYGPRANPIERAVGAVHDLCTRPHTRKRLPDLVADVEAPLHVHGPCTYQLSELSYEPAITAAVENIARDGHTKVAA